MPSSAKAALAPKFGMLYNLTDPDSDLEIDGSSCVFGAVFRLYLFVCILWHAGARGGTGFDCAKARSTLDHVICSSDEAIGANERHTAVLQAVLGVLVEQRQALLTEQRDWNKQLPVDCGVPGHTKPKPQIIGRARSCFVAKTEARIKFLERSGASTNHPDTGTHSPQPNESTVFPAALALDLKVDGGAADQVGSAISLSWKLKEALPPTPRLNSRLVDDYGIDPKTGKSSTEKAKLVIDSSSAISGKRWTDDEHIEMLVVAVPVTVRLKV